MMNLWGMAADSADVSCLPSISALATSSPPVLLRAPPPAADEQQRQDVWNVLDFFSHSADGMAGGTSSTCIFTWMNWYMPNPCPPSCPTGHSNNHRHRFPWRRVRANCTGWCIRMVLLSNGHFYLQQRSSSLLKVVDIGSFVSGSLISWLFDLDLSSLMDCRKRNHQWRCLRMHIYYTVVH